MTIESFSVTPSEGVIDPLTDLWADGIVGGIRMLDEMRTGTRRVSYETLATLPDRTLPELDVALLSRYARGGRDDGRTLETRATAAWLISRYGSDAVRPSVEAWLREPLPCADEAAAIAYLLRRNDTTMPDRVNQERAGQPGCVDPLSALSARYWDDHVESAAIARLDDRDRARAATGAQVLGAHGSVSVKTPLLQRLERLATERQGDAVPPRTGSLRPSPSDQLENALINALFENRRLRIDDTDVARMRAACASDSCRTNVDARAGVPRMTSHRRRRSTSSASGIVV